MKRCAYFGDSKTRIACQKQRHEFAMEYPWSANDERCLDREGR